MKRYFYILCFLPGIESIHDSPPITKKNLLSLVKEFGGPADIVEMLLLEDDLVQREAVLAGEIEPDHSDPTVLSPEQSKGKEPLPEYLILGPAVENEIAENLIPGDRIRRNYFYHVLKTAESNGSRFLKAWVAFEVGLRNALVKIRALALNSDPKPYLVAPELEDSQVSFENILEDWTAASNPLEAAEAIDRARWKWQTDHEEWFSFTNDEIAAYTAKLMILHHRQEIFGKHHV